MGEIKPGYTRISEIVRRYSGYDNVPKYVLDAACHRGTMVHDLISATMSGVGFPEIPEYIMGYYESFEKWFSTQNACTFLMPERWYDDETMLTGECDCLMQQDGKTTLIDFKTSAQENKAWMLQAGGYLFLSKKCGINVDKVSFFRLSKFGKEILETEYDCGVCETLFKKALDIHAFFR